MFPTHSQLFNQFKEISNKLKDFTWKEFRKIVQDKSYRQNREMIILFLIRYFEKITGSKRVYFRHKLPHEFHEKIVNHRCPRDIIVLDNDNNIKRGLWIQGDQVYYSKIIPYAKRYNNYVIRCRCGIKPRFNFQITFGRSFVDDILNYNKLLNTVARYVRNNMDEFNKKTLKNVLNQDIKKLIF